jgi:hypothetical protein
MPHCDNCGQERSDTRKLVLYSARILSLATHKLAPGSQTTDTTYDELVRHDFQVCARCLNWDRVRPYLIALGAILLPAAAMIAMGAMRWPTAVAVVVSLVVMVGGGVAMGHLGEPWRIHKRMLEPLEKLDPRHTYRVFSESEYRKLDVKIKPPT